MSTRQTLSTYRHRKHSKTFTGCWTCRARKVKCDELRPECGQCSRKGVKCEGYDIRLHWMGPETVDGIANNPSQSSQPKCRRSRVALGPSPPALNFRDIDEILFTLDSLSTKNLRNSGHEGGLSRFFQCFGVFDTTVSGQDSVTQTEQPSQQSHDNIDSTTSPVSSFDVDSLQTIEPPGFYQSCTDGNVLPLSPFRHLDGAVPWTFNTYEGILPILPLQDSDLSLDSEAYVNEDTETSSSQDRQEVPTKLFPCCPPPSGLSSQERFLMHHYTNRVVYLFSVLDNPKSPWKTVHLPRALQSAGELAVQGSTSEIKNSLRIALLSISAFCLSNDHRIQSNQDEARKWVRAATCYRGKAIRHLKEAVNSGFSSESRPKYKECLATMLSMVTINVISGDTETCGMHLDGAYRLISQARRWKSKYSNKAQALHRIYFYLRTIYQSTLIRTRDNNSDKQGTCGPSGSIISGIPPDDNATTGPSSSPPEDSADMCTYMHIYGIPYSLLALLNRVVELVNRVVDERERTGMRVLPTHLDPQCDELEASIMEWKAELPPIPYTTSSKASANSDIIKHMTRAFHTAVIIYFAQHVRLLGHHYLQPFIKRVIESIEAIESIKVQTEILAAPLYWPAFIAASEAFDPGLQERFRRWYNQVEVYGIEGVRTGIRVLSDVWDQGPCPGATTTSIWRMVVQRTGAVLLLS